MRKESSATSVPADKLFAEQQLQDKEIGTFVSMQLTRYRPPDKAELQSESELTK